MPATELNLDGLIGPTHNYAGLAVGNLASASHKGRTSHPRRAALQGLAKMELLAALGVRQAVLPPHERPDLGTLRALGFTGKDADVVAAAHREAPQLLAACYSASSMWTANAATVSPAADTADGRLHITVANLQSNLHRAIEAPFTEQMLRLIFADAPDVAVHAPLPASHVLGDEGAANHTRLCGQHGEAGVELFVFGRYGTAHEPVRRTGLQPVTPIQPAPRRHPARQTFEASACVARLHRLDPAATLFAQQNPRAVDAGVFHNDVISTGNEGVFLYHEQAFVDTSAVIAQLRRLFAKRTGRKLRTIEVKARQVTLKEAVRTYLFNSQIVTQPDGGMAMVCPIEAGRSPRVRRFLNELLRMNTPIVAQHFADLRQSMHNGGGPACLRLRVVLTDRQLAGIHAGVRWSEALGVKLRRWINARYREEIRPDDLRDPKLIRESRDALNELTRILDLGNVYSFQQ